jgi:hypothetical protein
MARAMVEVYILKVGDVKWSSDWVVCVGWSWLIEAVIEIDDDTRTERIEGRTQIFIDDFNFLLPGSRFMTLPLTFLAFSLYVTSHPTISMQEPKPHP